MESGVESRESGEKVRSYRDLRVWQQAMDFAKAIYSATQAYPREELYGLTNQTRRAVTSIPSNLAEGSSRRSTQEFIRYVNIACGSLAELETQLILAESLAYLPKESLQSLLETANQISRQLQALHIKLIAKTTGAVTRLPTPDSRLQ